MTSTSPGSADRVLALSRARADFLAFCRTVSDEEWLRPSAAHGWTVIDVVAHLGGSAHGLFTPAALTMLRSGEIERTNDELVGRREGWSPREVVQEYETWSRRLLPLARGVEATPLRRIPVRMAELGRFPAGLLLTGAFVFDHHVHLRHDLVPALGRPLPAPDPLQLAVAIEWMMAVLANQVRGGAVPGIRGPLALELRGPGGGEWTLSADGVRAGRPAEPVAVVSCRAETFPLWATRRAAWRDDDVALSGDVDHAASVLDLVNVI